MDITVLKARSVGGLQTKQVRVDFTPEKLAGFKNELAENEIELGDMLKSFAVVRGEHNVARKELEAKRDCIVDDIRRGYVDVSKEVLLVPDYENGMMSIYRADTGDIVESRRLHPTERQTTLV